MTKVDYINYLTDKTKFKKGKLWSMSIGKLESLYNKVKTRTYDPNNLYDVIKKLVEVLR